MRRNIDIKLCAEGIIEVILIIFAIVNKDTSFLIASGLFAIASAIYITNR